MKKLMIVVPTVLIMLLFVSAKPATKTDREDSIAVRAAASFYQFEKSISDLKDRMTAGFPGEADNDKSSLPMMRMGNSNNMEFKGNPMLDMSVRRIKENIRSVFTRNEK